jgi:hypothetical protein
MGKLHQRPRLVLDYHSWPLVEFLHFTRVLMNDAVSPFLRLATPVHVGLSHDYHHLSHIRVLSVRQTYKTGGLLVSCFPSRSKMFVSGSKLFHLAKD